VQSVLELRQPTAQELAKLEELIEEARSSKKRRSKS
jgi:hypothetical protein